jgi:UDP-N-acetylmuramoyl-tripeptide--D-alanyl-D-alanine ligase
MPLDTEIGLIEIGTNGFGEIRFLSELLKPNFGIITNIGKEHLEGFGDIEGVAREESELFHYLMRHDGLAFVNADDVYLGRMSHRLSDKFSYTIEDKDAHCVCNVDSVVPQLVMEVNGQKITSVLNGLHNAQNIAAAVAIGRYFELSLEDIAQGVADYNPSNNRSEVRIIGSNHILMDAYNANPSSMEVALHTFNAIQCDKKVVLLGDMFELGANAAEEHRLIAEMACDVKNAEVFLAGELFVAASKNLEVTAFPTTDDLIKHLGTKSYSDTWFLVKGSRGMKMERVLEALEANV